MSGPYDVVTINKSSCYSMLRDGTICHWSRMYDAEGEETLDVAEAITATHPLPDGTWNTIFIHEWINQTIH